MRSVADEYDFADTVGSEWSVGSVTLEWMENTFSENYRDEMSETTYICGDPHSDSKLESHSSDTLDEVWKSAWTNTVPPRAVTDRTIQRAREDGGSRLLVHYMQPHCPFIPWGDRAEQKTRERSGDNPGKDVWQKLRDGDVTKEEVWEGYQANLRIVMDEVAFLLGNVDAERVVITSDHGNMLGEWGIYGHKPSLAFQDLREVPWIETSARDRGTHTPDFEFEDGLNVNREEQLKSLGYI